MNGDYDPGLPARYGSRFFVEGVPDERFLEDGMATLHAYNLQEEVGLGGPARNPATLVNRKELLARGLIKQNLHYGLPPRVGR